MRRRRSRGIVRGDVHADAEPLEDRRRAGRVAAARPVRRVGRDRYRDIRAQCAGRQGRREFHVATGRHIARRDDRVAWGISGLRRAEDAGRHTLERRGGIQRHRPERAQDHCDTGTRVGLVRIKVCRGSDGFKAV